MSCRLLPGDFWGRRLQVNAHSAIFHQWKQLEASGCIENFRIAAGQSEALRQGWFFADSDAYKWLEAACLVLEDFPNPKLQALIDGFISLISQAQDLDGYIFTYNQIHFPGVRWKCLQIEHELYCHGHLIEAGVSHHQVTGQTTLLEIARKAAGRIAADFLGKGPSHTPGHEEIEIALLRLHEVSPGDSTYLNLARQFIEQRGRGNFFGFSMVGQNFANLKRSRIVRELEQDYRRQHTAAPVHQVPPGNAYKKPPFTAFRWFASVCNGKYFQQHRPIRKQEVPVGHSVRFAYLTTAAAMLARLTGDRSLLPSLETSWERMVTRRMYVTGGLGSLPVSEGFGRDYELDPEYAYAETCAALASLMWNHEMSQLTGDPRYSDLFEWQLYNAAAVGMGLDGTHYLYNNPLACRSGVQRREWFAVPCCPSNLSRVWARLDEKIYSLADGKITINQYISSNLDLSPQPVRLKMSSGLPWSGIVRIEIEELPKDSEIVLRRPSWASSMEITVNGIVVDGYTKVPLTYPPTASGFDPRTALHIPLHRNWQPGDTLDILFEMNPRPLTAHSRVKGHAGKVALTRGPLVYCLESIDNPQIDIFTTRLNLASLSTADRPDLLDGITLIQGRSLEGEILTFIPYFLWGNRGPSQMNVWVNT